MKTKITELLGIKYPIIQGGMAWTSEACLASAVSNAGGAGIIACGGRTAEWVREDIRKAKTLTDKPFGVNVMLMAPNVDEIVDVICEEKPAFVTLGAGNPVPFIKKFQDAVFNSLGNGVKVHMTGDNFVSCTAYADQRFFQFFFGVTHCIKQGAMSCASRTFFYFKTTHI